MTATDILYDSVSEYLDDPSWTGYLLIQVKNGQPIGHKETRTYVPAQAEERTTESAHAEHR